MDENVTESSRLFSLRPTARGHDCREARAVGRPQRKMRQLQNLFERRGASERKHEHEEMKDILIMDMILLLPMYLCSSGACSAVECWGQLQSASQRAQNSPIVKRTIFNDIDSKELDDYIVYHARHSYFRASKYSFLLISSSR